MRFDGVQGLRFVAALLVVVTHSTFYTSERLDPAHGYWFFGAVGVDIFFIISGFVMMISSPSFSRDRRGAARFGYRRIIRIAPMYWVATTIKILTVLVLPAAAIHSALTPSRVLGSYFFLPTRGPDGDTGVLLGVGWTLLFEMLFYVIFTIGLWLGANPFLFSSAVLGFFAVGSAFRPVTNWPVWAYDFNPVVLYFIVGMLFGKLVMSEQYRARAWRLAVALTVTVIVIALVPGGVRWGSHSPFRMLTVSALVLSVIVAEPLLRRLARKPVLFLGNASYSIYLFHPLIAPPVPVVLAKFGIINFSLAVVLSVVIAIGSTSLIYQLVERPVTRRLRSEESRVLRDGSRPGGPTIPAGVDTRAAVQPRPTPEPGSAGVLS